MTEKFTWKERLGMAAADLLMLLLGLYGALFSFLTAFPLPVDEEFLLPACVLAAMAAAAVFSLPRARYRLPLVLLWLGWMGWTVWNNFSDLVLAALACAERVGAVFARKLDLGLVAPDFSQELSVLTVAKRQEVCTLLCVLFLLLLALWLGWAVVRRRSFWLGFWGTFPILLVPLSITVTPRWIPLMALLLFWATGVLTRLVKKDDPRGNARLTLAVLPLTALLLFLLGLALPEERYERAAWIPKARAEALDELSGMVRGVSIPSGLTGLAGGGAEADLRHAGPLRYTGSPVLRVESEITGHIYLRGFSAGKYTDRGWEQLSESTYDEMRDGWSVEESSPAWSPQAASSQSDPQIVYGVGSDRYSFISLPAFHPGIGSAQPLNFPAQADRAAHPEVPARRFTIESVGLSSGYMYTPYQLATTPDNMTGAEFMDDAYLARDVGIRRYVLYARTDTYASHLRPSVPDAESELAYRAFVYREYLNVPEGLESALDRFLDRYGMSELSPRYSDSSLQSWGISPLSAAETIARLLGQETVYDPDTPVTPEGQDFVKYFLITSKRGYCMHYASAATLLLRYLGVPARYVAGYTADVVANQTVTVPDQNAHAWVEVYVDGYGWQPVEVTPGFTLPGTESFITTPSPTPSQSLSPSEQPETPEPSRAPLRPEPDEDVGGPAQAGLLDLRFLLPPALLLLLAALLAARRRLILERRRRRFAAPDANRAVIAMYLYQQRLLRFHRGTALDEAAELLGQKAKFSQHTLTEEERLEMLEHIRQLTARTEALPGRWRGLTLRYIWALL
jgi:transglutaminase-like putative cysteine protease